MTNQTPSGARRVLGNSAWLIAAEGATRVASLLAILYLSRTLARDGLGIVQFGMALFGLLQLVCGAGIDAQLTREAARTPDQLPRLAGQSLIIGWTLLAIAFGAVVAGLFVVPIDPAMRRNAIVFGLGAVFVPVALRFTFVAGERLRAVGLGVFVGQLTFLGLCLAAVHGPDDLGRVAVVWGTAMAARAALQFAAFVGAHGLPVFDGHGFVSRLRRTVAVSMGGVARGLVLSVDVIVLGLVGTPEEVARYGLATKLPLFLASLATLFYTALFPTLVRADADADERRVGRIEAETVAAVLGVALPGAVCLMLAVDPIIRVLFTDRFLDVAPLLAVLVWRLPLLAASGVFRTVLWARNPASDARIAIQILVATVVLLLIVAPAGGATAVAWAVLGGDLIALVLYVRATGPIAATRVGGPAAIRIGLAAAVALGVMLLVPHAAGFVTLAAAIAVWAATTLVADLPYLRRVATELRGTVR